MAVSPPDNSLTEAWVSQASSLAKILAGTRISLGTWSSVVIVSTGPVWTSANSGINIDQGPSPLIDPSGTRHLAYIENWDNTNSYGRIHYVVNTGSGWSDTALNWYTHDPARAVNCAGDVTSYQSPTLYYARLP